MQGVTLGLMGHNNKVAKHKDNTRTKIAKLYVAGLNQVEIAAELGVSQPYVSQELGKIRKFWQEQYTSDYTTKLNRELAKLDMLELEAWAAWARSCGVEVTNKVSVESALRQTKNEDDEQPKLTAKGKVDGRSTKRPSKSELVPVKKLTERVKRSQVGDASFLNIIKGICEMRLKLIGAFKEPDKDSNDKKHLLFPWDRLIQTTQVTDPAEEAIRQLGPAPSGEETDGTHNNDNGTDQPDERDD